MGYIVEVISLGLVRLIIINVRLIKMTVIC